MIRTNLLYQSAEKFRQHLNSVHFNVLDVCLVRIYTAICTKEQAVSIAIEIKETLPNAKIVGASGSGVIFDGKQYDSETLVMIEKLNDGEFVVNTHTYLDKSAKEVARELVNDIKGKEVPLMHVLFSDHYYDIHNFVEEFNKLNNTTTLVGGIVGDVLPKDIIGYVFTENGVVENGVVSAALCGTEMHIYNAVNIAHTPISNSYNVSKASGDLILEIERESGVDWCREQFGMENLTEYDDWQLIAENDALIRFPMILEGHGGASRFLRYDVANEKMALYFCQIEDNTKFRIGYTSPISCLQGCLSICNSIIKVPVESLFCYSCLFRKLYLGNCAEWELRPFLNHNICGVFMMGEISKLNGRNEFLNGSCCFVGVADQETYIDPDFNVFEDLYKIRDDNQKLLSFVLQKQGTAMSNENEKLLKKLMQQEEKEQERLYIDSNTNLPNSIKFSQDNQTKHFNKMCMVQIENSKLLLAKLGQDAYYALLRDVIEGICEYAKTLSYNKRLFYYCLNSNTFFVVTNDSINEAKFLKIVDVLYNKYQFIKSNSGEELLINRFVIVLNQEDLLYSGLTTLQTGKGLQTHFLISDSNTADDLTLTVEMNTIRVLNYVIEEKRVIPYFQGVYDNELKIIIGYEALMRIEDAEGKVYAPAFFMDIAKKYHMYGLLSKMMIEQVFLLFANREERVAINLSAYDINFDEMQKFIFSLLENTKNANNIVFELLEDENFKDMDRLKLFIDKVRQYGVAIAIDDFGSGYSNFVETIKIEPDYIKVDMAIIRNIDKNAINRKVLETIAFLGKQINAKVVAEGVENEIIQEYIETLDVQFSQGYYFAKPVPYEELRLKDDY